MASKRRIRRKACGKKRRYGTQDEAVAAIRTLVRDKGYQGFLSPYRCQFCNGFHVGHPPRHIRQAIIGGRA